jgi:tetratricopeptide (TPR) repeat protein
MQNLLEFRVRFKAVFASFVLAGLLLQGAAPEKPSAVDLLIQKARSLEARDRADLAAQVWQQILITNPNQPDALAGLARWAKRSGKMEEANAYIARLHKAAPDAAALGQLDAPDASKTQKGRLDEAAKLAAAQRYDEAMQVYREIFGSNPPAGGWALAYYETLAHTPEGFEPAVAALKKLAGEYPNVLDYQVTVGRLLTYRPATRLAGVGMLSAMEGTSPAATKAQAAWRQALVWEKGNRAYLPSLRSYLSRYSDPELKAAADRLGAMPAGNGPEIAMNKDEQAGYEALKSGETEAAERHFDAALKADGHNSRAQAGLGFVRMKQGDFARAAEEFQTAKNLSPKNTHFEEALETAKFWTAMQSAAKAAQEGNWDEAITNYRSALAIKSSDADALQGMSGAYLGAGQPAQALSYLQRWTQLQPNAPSAWQALMSAKLQAEGGKSALKLLRSVPPAVAEKLWGQPEWKITLASAYLDAGQEEAASKLFSELRQADDSELQPEAQVRMAGLQLQFHQPAQAAEAMRRFLAGHSENTGAWEVLISALVAAHQEVEAESAYRRMPEQARQTALEHPGFLQSLASVEASQGNLEGGIAHLQKILEMPSAVASAQTKLGVKMQLAPMLAKNGQMASAQSIMEGVLEAQPQDEQAWRIYLLLLQDAQQTGEVVTAAARMPQSVAVRLGMDSDIVTVLATAHAAGGDPEFAIRLLETYLNRPKAGEPVPPVRLQLQLSWLLLKTAGGGRDLYRLLEQLRARPDLTAAQRSEMSDLWSTWIVRTADRARSQGNSSRALEILAQGVSAFPENASLQRSFAGYLMKAGDSKRALNVYSNWGLRDATASDYAGAIGAALSQRSYQYADTWIAQGLAKWPTDSKLLALAGERAQARGDLKKAERYWREALAQRQSGTTTEVAQMEKPAPSTTLKSLLLGPDANSVEQVQVFPAPGHSTTKKLDIHLSSLRAEEGVNTASPVPAENFMEPPGSVGNAVLPRSGESSAVTEAKQSTSDSLEDKLASIQSRSTPFLESRTSVQSRSGQAGYDRLLIEQANLEASTVIANQFRVSMIAKPTYLDDGQVNGQSTLRLGTMPAGTSSARRSASGLATEAQISSQTFGLLVGTGPQDFPVKNVIAGFRFQPANGPFTFLLERDNVKDTMLSYAGVRDGGSGQIWGGVVANSASVLGHWGDDKSGVYASLGYQSLLGQSVAGNRAVNGNAGTYWKVAGNQAGSLTVGLNFSAMHYDKNLRYFTLGQGGYFSPQQYYLFNVPFRWTGTYNHKLQYIVGGSLGVQRFHEDASPFFPTNAALQALKGSSYSAMTSTGANFNIESRLNYQLAPHWMVGGWVNANNARDYVAYSIGLFVKYTFQPRPLSFDDSIPSVPDWRGQQPFTLF